MLITLGWENGIYSVVAAGSADVSSGGDSLAEAVSYIPDGAKALVDLRAVTAMSALSAVKLRRAVCSRLAEGVTPVVIADHENVRLQLILVDLDHLVAMPFTTDQARAILPGDLLV